MATSTTTTTTDPNANRTRVGGILLTIGAVLWAVGFGIYAFGIAPTITGDTVQERATQVLEVQQLVQASGWIGVFADVFVAAGALFLVTRWLATKNDFPASAFWLVVAIGALINLMGDMVWGNGVVPVAQAIGAGGATPDGALLTAYDALETTLGVTFSVGFFVLFGGFATVLWGETRAQNSAIPNWASYVGILGAAVVMVTSLVFLFGGPEEMGMAFVAGYLPGLAILWLGVRTGFPTFMGGEGAKTTRRASKA